MSIYIKGYSLMEDYKMQIEKIKQRALEDTFKRLARAAKRNKITEMKFLDWEVIYIKDGEKVDCKELDEIESDYIQNICNKGFVAIWTVKDGWTACNEI